MFRYILRCDWWFTSYEWNANNSVRAHSNTTHWQAHWVCFMLLVVYTCVCARVFVWVCICKSCCFLFHLLHAYSFNCPFFLWYCLRKSRRNWVRVWERICFRTLQSWLQRLLLFNFFRLIFLVVVAIFFSCSLQKCVRVYSTRSQAFLFFEIYFSVNRFVFSLSSSSVFTFKFVFFFSAHNVIIQNIFFNTSIFFARRLYLVHYFDRFLVRFVSFSFKLRCTNITYIRSKSQNYFILCGSFLLYVVVMNEFNGKISFSFIIEAEYCKNMKFKRNHSLNRALLQNWEGKKIDTFSISTE